MVDWLIKGCRDIPQFSIKHLNMFGITGGLGAAVAWVPRVQYASLCRGTADRAADREEGFAPTISGTRLMPNGYVNTDAFDLT